MLLPMQPARQYLLNSTCFRMTPQSAGTAADTLASFPLAAAASSAASACSPCAGSRAAMPLRLLRLMTASEAAMPAEYEFRGSACETGRSHDSASIVSCFRCSTQHWSSGFKRLQCFRAVYSQGV